MRPLGLFLMLMMVLPLGVLGQTIPEYRPLAPGDLNVGSVEGAVRSFGERIANLFGTVILAVSVIMILFAAFGFLTAGGDAERITAARNRLIYALVGVAVATFAFVLPVLVADLFRA